MSEPETPKEPLSRFTAREAPVWRRQLIGGLSAAALLATMGVPDVGSLTAPARDALRDFAPYVLGWLAVALAIRFYIAVGWRVVDEIEIDFKTGGLRLGQRRVQGRRQRTVQVHELATVREVSFGSYRRDPLDWFVFKLKGGEKIRFRCPPGILAMTRRSL